MRRPFGCGFKGRKYGMKAEKKMKTSSKLLAVLLIPVVMFTMAGCRESKVIEQILYDQMAEEIDWDNDTKVADNNKENKEKDEDLEEKKKDDTDRQRDRKREAPLQGDGKDNGKASGTTHDSNSDNNNKSEDKSTKPGDKDGDGDDGSSNKDQQQTPGDGTGGATDDPNGRPIVDDSGKEVEVPEDVNKVTAVGEAALVTQMLGGGGTLIASSDSFVSDPLACSVFAGEGISDVERAWNGDGSTAISDSSFEKLLAKKPDVCFSISGQSTFSDAQRSKLKQAGIAEVTLPSMTTASGVKQAVTIVGDVLGDRTAKGGTDAPELAKQYVSYCEDLQQEVEAKVGNKSAYTLLISDWDSSASYKLYSGSKITRSGTGVAVAPTSLKAGLVSSFMETGGVKNSASKYSNRNKSYWYTSPLNPVTRTLSYTGNAAAKPQDGVVLTRAKSDDTYRYLGTSDFPAIVVAKGSIKEKIKKDDTMWKVYGRTSSSSGNVQDEYGFNDEDGNIIPTTIHGNYDIHVNPSGIGNWTGGSVESVLECVWAAGTFHEGTYSKSDIRKTIEDFYKTFYRHTLTEQEYQRILEGL